MPKVTREYKESTLYPLSSVEIGNFFEYNKKLFIRLPDGLTKHKMIPCWSFSNYQLFRLSPSVNVYKCPNVEIKYNLESKYEEEIPEDFE